MIRTDDWFFSLKDFLLFENYLSTKISRCLRIIYQQGATLLSVWVTTCWANITLPTNFKLFFFFFCIGLCQHYSAYKLQHFVLLFVFVFGLVFVNITLAPNLIHQILFLLSPGFVLFTYNVRCRWGWGPRTFKFGSHIWKTYPEEPSRFQVLRLSQNTNPEQKSILNIYIWPGKTYAHSFSTVDKWYQWSIAFLISIYQQLWSLNRNNKITTCFCLTSNMIPSLITNQHCFDQMLLLRRVTKLQLINHKSEKLTKHGELDQRHRWWSIE